MASVTINGAALPVKELQENYAEIGTAIRAFDGTQRKQARALKRTWQLRTPLLSATEADMWERLLMGRGDAFSFDDHLFSAKGAKPTTFANAVFKRGLAADGLPVLYQGKFRSSGACNTSGVANKLTANQSNVETDTTGFSAVDGATISRDTLAFYEGVASLKVITSGVVNGTRGGMAALATSDATQVWTVSAYVMAATAITVRVVGRNNTLGTDGTPTTVTLTPYTWQRIEAQSPSVTSGDVISLRVLEETADSAITFYVDNLQIENTLTFAKPWTVGGSTSTSGAVIYTPFSLLTSLNELTISAWVGKINETNGIAWRTSVGTGGGSPRHRLFRQAATTLRLSSLRADAATENVDITGCWTASVQNMITCVLRTSGSYEVYKDGALFASAAVGLNLSDHDTFSIACTEVGGTDGDGTVDDLIVLPFAVDAATVAGWYGLGKSIAVYPRLWLGGDSVPEGPVLVQAKMPTSAFDPTATYGNAGRAIALTLEEV